MATQMKEASILVSGISSVNSLLAIKIKKKAENSINIPIKLEFAIKFFKNDSNF